MSGFTTTGASVLNTLVDVPKSILLWRCIIQWIGGLGIILFTLAVVPMLNYSGGMQLFNAEVTGITHDKLRPQVSYTAKGLWGVYAIFTGILIVLLAFSKMDFSTRYVMAFLQCRLAASPIPTCRSRTGIPSISRR